MSDYGRLALGNQMVVTKYEVFFVNEQSARRTAQKYGAKLTKLDDGWLVTKEIRA